MSIAARSSKQSFISVSVADLTTKTLTTEEGAAITGDLVAKQEFLTKIARCDIPSDLSAVALSVGQVANVDVVANALISDAGFDIGTNTITAPADGLYRVQVHFLHLLAVTAPGTTGRYKLQLWDQGNATTHDLVDKFFAASDVTTAIGSYACDVNVMMTAGDVWQLVFLNDSDAPSTFNFPPSTSATPAVTIQQLR
jgi:hypothetical protein